MPETNSFNPFAHITNFAPPVNVSLFEHYPVVMSTSQFMSRIKFMVGPLRLDKDPRKHMFLWQRDHFAWLRHRKRMPYYWAATFGINAAILHARAAAVGYVPDGSGILRAIRAKLYSGHDILDCQHFRPIHMQNTGPFSRISRTHPYGTAFNSYNAPRQIENVLKTPEEIAGENALMKKIFTGDAGAFEKKMRWWQVCSEQYLPVSNCPKVNATATESMMKGIEALIQAKPLAECRAHFGVVEKLRYEALDKWTAPKPAADGSFNLRFAWKALWWREANVERRFKGQLMRPFDLGRFHEHIKYLPLLAVVHWLAWNVVVGSFGASFEDWKLRNNLDLLATWGPLSDERPFEERKADWKKTLAEEAKAGKWVFRDWGWLNGFAKFQHMGAHYYYSDN